MFGVFSVLCRWVLCSSRLFGSGVSVVRLFCQNGLGVKVSISMVVMVISMGIQCGCGRWLIRWCVFISYGMLVMLCICMGSRCGSRQCVLKLVISRLVMVNIVSCFSLFMFEVQNVRQVMQVEVIVVSSSGYSWCVLVSVFLLVW